MCKWKRRHSHKAHNICVNDDEVGYVFLYIYVFYTSMKDTKEQEKECVRERENLGKNLLALSIRFLSYTKSYHTCVWM